MKLLLRIKGGPGSGHRGHTGGRGGKGNPGGSTPGGGGVSSVDPNWESKIRNGKPITVYHATPGACIAAIRREGLKGGVTAQDVVGGRAVYFTASDADALVYGEDEGHSGKFGIVEFTIPVDRYRDIVFDDYDFNVYGYKNSFYIPGDIPKEWIQHIRLYRETARGSFRRVKQGSAKTVVRMGYSVVFIDDEVR